MKTQIKNLFIVVLLAMLMIAVTNCTENNSEVEVNEETKIAQAVQATLAMATAMEGTVAARVQATQNALPGSIPPTEEVIQPTITPENDNQATLEALQATQTAMAASGPIAPPPAVPAGPFTISSPADGSTVGQFAEVSGFVDKSVLDGKYLNIIVTTRTMEYWVQKAPTIQADGAWSASPVVFGTVTVGNNEQFIICAVVSDKQLGEGQIYTYPTGTKECVTVTRRD